MSYAKAFILGNLTRDPEMRVTPQGTSVVNFGVAVSRKFKQGDQEREQTSFFDCVAYAKTGEAIAKHFTKGKPIFIDVRPEQQSWEDKNTKERRTKFAFIVNEFQFAGGDRETAKASTERNMQRAKDPSTAPKGENLDEDVPF